MGGWRGRALWLAVAGAGVGCGDGDGPLFPEFSDVRTLADHREVDIRFASGELTLSGTLYLPRQGERFPAVAFHPGSSWTVRSSWAEVGFFVESLDVAVFSYDRRGSGASGGTCCVSSADELFSLFAEDLAAAVLAVSASPLVEPGQLGVMGSSLGAWIAPLTANLLPQRVSFVVSAVGGAVSTGQEALYDELTGYDVCQRSELSIEQITDRLREAGPSGFDPAPSLELLTQPALWLLGERDYSHPTDLTIEILDQIRATLPKDWTVAVIEGANHDLIRDGGICQATGPLADVLPPIQWWMSRILPRR